MANLDTLDRALAHGLARLGLGVDIALHGLTRLPKLATFAGGMEKEFAKTVLPGALVFATGCGIVIGETIIGALLVLGLWLRPALVGGMLLMILLLFGVSLLEKWEIAALQLTYVAFYAGLLATVSWDRYSVDGWLRGRKKG